jgi:hypothetical protein
MRNSIGSAPNGVIETSAPGLNGPSIVILSISRFHDGQLPTSAHRRQTASGVAVVSALASCVHILASLRGVSIAGLTCVCRQDRRSPDGAYGSPDALADWLGDGPDGLREAATLVTADRVLCRQPFVLVFYARGWLGTTANR